MAEVIRGSKAEQLKVFLPNSKERCVVWLEPEFIEAMNALTGDRKSFLTQAITNVEGNRASAIRCYIVEQLLNERQILKQCLRQERSAVLSHDKAVSESLFNVEPCHHPIQLIYNFPAKNRKRDIEKKIKQVSGVFDFDSDNLTPEQEQKIIDWCENDHKKCS